MDADAIANAESDTRTAALIKRLGAFYYSDTLVGIILSQDKHIERLQERVKFLTPKNNFIITKVREG